MNFLKILLVSIFFITPSFSDYKDNLENVASEILKIKPEDVKIQKQRKGMTSAGTYSIEAKDKKYILKIFSKKQKEDLRKKELEFVKIFSNLELGAKLVGVSKDNSAYIREYIDGKTLKYETMQDQDNIKSLAIAIKKLHNYKYEASESPNNHLERVEKHYKRAKEKNIALPSSFEKSLKDYKEKTNSLPKETVFCHNDLNPHNIIMDSNRNIYFIDLAGAGNSNRYEELGYITLLNGIFGENLKIFLDSYFGRKTTEDELKFVKLSQKLTCFLTSIVWFDFSESKKDKDIPIADRVKNLDNMLESKDLKSATQLISTDTYVSIKSHKKDMIRNYAAGFYKEFVSTKF